MIVYWKRVNIAVHQPQLFFWLGCGGVGVNSFSSNVGVGLIV